MLPSRRTTLAGGLALPTMYCFRIFDPFHSRLFGIVELFRFFADLIHSRHKRGIKCLCARQYLWRMPLVRLITYQLALKRCCHTKQRLQVTCFSTRSLASHQEGGKRLDSEDPDKILWPKKAFGIFFLRFRHNCLELGMFQIEYANNVAFFQPHSL